MKKFKMITIFALVVSAFVLTGCYKEEDSRGLTRDIREFMPENILKTVEDLGMPIYGGNTPPDITGTFFMSPSILKASNFDRPTDIGSRFTDATIIYSDQDNKDLTVKVFQDNLRDGSDGGNGTGGFIVGKDKNFTVFVKLVDVDKHGHKATAAMLYSGTMSDSGIKDFHISVVMVDNGGNPDGDLIDNGHCRLIYDSDGFSEKVTSSKSSAQSEIPSETIFPILKTFYLFKSCARHVSGIKK